MKVTSPPLFAEPTSAAVALDRISQIRLSVVSRGSMHIGLPGSPVSVNGINIRYLSVIFVSWNIYSFNAITTGVNARALRVPHTSFRVHYKGAGKGGSASLTDGIASSVILLPFNFSNLVSTPLHELDFGGSGSHRSLARVVLKQRPTLSQLHAT